MKKIVVTGALGHIGSLLIRELPKSFPDVEILLVDNFACQRYCSLFNLPENGKYRFVEADILECDLSALIQGADALVHLAAITNAADSFKNAAAVEQVNSVGTERVARACASEGVSFVFLSTTSIYGTQESEVDEDCPRSELNPQSPYAKSKLQSEDQLREFGRELGLKHISLRFGTIVGASQGMRFHTAVNKFCWQAVLGLPITVWRTALDQRRPYLSIHDGVAALVFLLKGRVFDGKIYNVVTENLSVRDIIARISEYIPNPTIDFVDTPIMNQLSYNVKSEKFRGLGFHFNGDLRKDIHETISLFGPIRYPGKST